MSERAVRWRWSVVAAGAVAAVVVVAAAAPPATRPQTSAVFAGEAHHPRGLGTSTGLGPAGGR